MTNQDTKKRRIPTWMFVVVTFLCFCLCLFAVIGSSINKTSTTTTNPSNESTQSNTVPVSTATPEPFGKTRDNPLPAGAVINIGDETTLTILEVTRPADSIVLEGNMFNSTPEPDLEYAIIKLQIQCNKSTNEKCSFSTYDIKAVGQNGKVQEQAFVAGIPNELETFSEFFGGSKLEGNIVFLISKDDKSTVLFYESLFGSPIYFAIP